TSVTGCCSTPVRFTAAAKNAGYEVWSGALKEWGTVPGVTGGVGQPKWHLAMSYVRATPVSMRARVASSWVKTARDLAGYSAWNTFSAVDASMTPPPLGDAKASVGTVVRCGATTVVGTSDDGVVTAGRWIGAVPGAVDSVVVGPEETLAGAPPPRTAAESTLAEKTTKTRTATAMTAPSARHGAGCEGWFEAIS